MPSAVPTLTGRLMCATAVLVVAAVVLTGCDGASEEAPPEFFGSVLEEAPPAPDIALSDQFGSRFDLGAQGGRAVLLFFGYTHCPDVCPLTLATWAAVAKDLGVDAERLVYVFVTVDPARDTSATLRDYLAHFDIPVVGLTGDEAAVARVWSDYGVYVEKGDVEDNGDYFMAHSALIYVIDAAGRIRLTFPYVYPADKVAHDLRLLLDERP